MKNNVFENIENEMMAYHGSAADFDNFDHSFMGTGEGAQSYGWGTYVTTDLSTSKYYARTANVLGGYYLINNSRVSKDIYIAVQIGINQLGLDNSVKEYPISEILAVLEKQKSLFESIYNTRKNNPKYSSYDLMKLENKISLISDGIGYLNNLGQTTDVISSIFSKNDKIIYEVEIPDDNGNNYFSFNEPNENVNEIAARLGIQEKFNTLEELQEYLNKNRDICTPRDLSMLMSSMGYVGIKMPTGYMSGGNGKGYNYVIFDEKNVKIMNKYDLLESKKIKGKNEIPPYEADEFMIGDEGGNLEYSHIVSEEINHFIYNETVKRNKFINEYFNRNELPDISQIGEFVYSMNFDEDEYHEYLQDNELEDTYENKLDFIKEYTTFEIEIKDNEYFSNIGFFDMQYSDIEDNFDDIGNALAEYILNDCLENGEGRVEKSVILDSLLNVDVNNPDSINAAAVKILPNGPYYKGCRGFILTNGAIIYTEDEHNHCSEIPGIKGTFDFIRKGNIRILRDSMDVWVKPTIEQQRVIVEIVRQFKDEDLYVSVLPNGEEKYKRFRYPTSEEVLMYINNAYNLQENIRNEMLVHHGSAANFNEFSTKYLGTGEGAQVYAWGIYLTQDQNVAEMYIRTALMANSEREFNRNLLKTITLRWRQKTYQTAPDAYGCVNGYLYGVEIPEDNGENYIKWTETDPQKLNSILARLKVALTKRQYNHIYKNINRNQNYANPIVKWFRSLVHKVSDFHFLYEQLGMFLGGQKAASQILRTIGIIGVKVPINFRKNPNYEKSNIVIFNENDIKIVCKQQIKYDWNKFDYDYAKNLSHKSIKNVKQL